MIDYIRTKVKNITVLDTERIIKACGSPRVLNVALLGAMAAGGFMDISLEEVSAALVQKLKPEFLAINEKALKLGAAAITGE